MLDNKYRLAERIGGGGMGDVFRAENVLAGRPVAIKFLHPELSQNTDLANRFFQEAQAVNRIRHPNVVDVLDAGVAEMGPYLVMELLEGESVGTSLSRLGRLEVECALAATIPVLEALDAAHRAGIIHRDLKPENVFLAFDATRSSVGVRLLDFGIAKMVDNPGPSPKTRTGVVFGTPDYLSPEQATGEAPLDGRSDLFSVGVLIYEMITGTRPFRAPTAVATAFKVVHAEAPTLAAAGVFVDTKIEAVVSRLLQKEPARRYPTAADVIRDLERMAPDPARRAGSLMRVLGASRRLGPQNLSDPRDNRRPDLSQPTQAARSLSNPSMRAADPLAGKQARSPRATPISVETALLGSAGGPVSTGKRSTSDKSSSTSIRPFPARFARRYQVRGPVLRSVDRALVDLFGIEHRDLIVRQMPEEYASDFRNDSINALVAYDIEALDAYMELASGLIGIDASKWREAGRLAVDGELNTMVKSLLRPAVDVLSLLKRGVAIWSRLFDFGTWRATSSPAGRVLLNVTEFDAVGLPLRWWVTGVVEQTARRAVRVDAKATIVIGEQEFVPDLSFEIS